MKTIHLDMDITAEQALAQHDALHESEPKQIRDAYWRRYCRIKEGVKTPVSYAVGDDAAPEEKKPAAKPDRLAMIRDIAERGGSGRPDPAVIKQPPASSEKPAPKPVRVPRAPKPAAAPRTGRVPALAIADYPAIHARILQAANELGYGDLKKGGLKPHGAAIAFQTNAKISSASNFYHTITTGKKIWPIVLVQISENIGISLDWMRTGEGEMFSRPDPIRFQYRETVAQRKSDIIAAVAPELAVKYPQRKITPTVEKQIADGWTPARIAAAALPPRRIATPAAGFANVTLVGKHAYTSAFAA